MVYRRKKTHKTTTGQNKTESNVGLAKVRASPGVIELFRSPLDAPVPHAHVPRSSHDFNAPRSMAFKTSMSHKMLHVYNIQYAVMKVQYVGHNHDVVYNVQYAVYNGQ